MRVQSFIVPVLVLMTLTVFWQTRDFDFVGYDDDVYVTDNRPVWDGMTPTNFSWAFSTTIGGLWQPLVLLSYMCDVELWGRNAGGFHLTNLLFHTFNVLLVYTLFRKLTGEVWKSAFVAALFAVHPLRVESVVWVTERKDVLSTFFGLLGILAYTFYVHRAKRKWFWAAWVGMAFSLMSKQMLVTFPFLLLLLDIWPLGRCDGMPGAARKQDEAVASAVRCHWSRLVREKIPFFLLTAVFCVIAFEAQRRGGATESLDSISITARLANAILSWGEYLWMTIWPTHLAVFYPHPGENIAWIRVGASAGVLIALTILAVRQLRRRPYLFVGWFWYLGALVPVIGLVQVGQQRLADRFTYVPLLGIFVAATWAGSELISGPRRKVVLPIFCTTALAALMVTAHVQTSYWQDSFTLSNRALAVTSGNHFAHNNLGVALQSLGQTEEAAIHYRQALEVQPAFAESHYNLATVLYVQGRIAAAIRHFRQALKSRPFHSPTHNNLGLALRDRGEVEEAVKHFLKAIELAPGNAQPHFNLGAYWAAHGDLQKAIRHLKQAVRAQPDYFEAQLTLGTTLAQIGQLHTAVRHLRNAVDLDPRNLSAQTNLGVSLSQIDRFDEAIQHFREAIRIDSSHVDAYVNIARVLAMTGHINEAEQHMIAAIEINPDEFQARLGMGLILMQQNRRDAAVKHLQKAVQLQPESAEARQFLQHAQESSTETDGR